MYKVLWIDDQFRDTEMIQFAIEADNEGLSLDGYPSFEEGFEALEKDLKNYDIILLDGLFFEKKGQEIGTEDESGIGMAIAKINELKSKKVFPWFVLSGKDKFTKGENSLLMANKAKCFDKTNPTDVIRLFDQMKKAARQQPDLQLKHNYSDLLEVCLDDYLGSTHYSRLFSLIRHVENLERLSSTEDMLNPIRKIIERIFIRMAEIGIIPEAIVANKVWINGSSLFLSNRHSDYDHQSEIIPPVIGENIHRLLNIIQDASHSDGDLKLRIDQYLKGAQSDYLYRSCVYLLFDMLLWFKDYIDSHGNCELNKSLWKSKLDSGEWIKGSVTRIADNGWGTFKPDNSYSKISIRPEVVKEKGLIESHQIKVKTEPSPDGTKTFIKAISKEL